MKTLLYWLLLALSLSFTMTGCLVEPYNPRPRPRPRISQPYPHKPTVIIVPRPTRPPREPWHGRPNRPYNGRPNDGHFGNGNNGNHGNNGRPNNGNNGHGRGKK